MFSSYMNYKIYSIWFMILLLLISSCATIVGNEFQQIPINSSPSKAKISITDEAGIPVFSGETPTIVKLNKHNGSYFGGKLYRVKIEKPNYQSQVITLYPSVNGWYIFGNLFFGGLIGWLIVDPLNGAMYTLSPKSVDCIFGEAKNKSTFNSKSINICLLDDVPENLQNNLHLINLKTDKNK